MRGRLFTLVTAGIVAVAVGVAAVVLGPPAFERMLRDYLQQHPEVVVEAIDLYHQREEANADNRQRALLAERDNELRFDTRSPILGNPNGDVTVVEFFDYKCPFCRQLHPQIAPLLAAEPGVRLVLKEFAILGPESTAAARASIAVWMRTPTRFEAFHDAMMRATGRLDETTILRLAREAGIDADGLMLDMADPKIDRIIAETNVLAHAIGVNGTPGLVIGDTVVPGYIDAAEIRRLIAQARQSCVSCRARAVTN